MFRTKNSQRSDLWAHSGSILFLTPKYCNYPAAIGSLTLCNHYCTFRLLCALCKLENMPSSTEMLVHSTSSTFPVIAVSDRLSCCLDHCFRLFKSLFEYQYFNRLQKTGALELN